MAAYKLVWADLSLRYTSMLLGRWAFNQQTPSGMLFLGCCDLSLLTLMKLGDPHCSEFFQPAPLWGKVTALDLVLWLNYVLESDLISQYCRILNTAWHMPFLWHLICLERQKKYWYWTVSYTLSPHKWIFYSKFVAADTNWSVCRGGRQCDIDCTCESLFAYLGQNHCQHKCHLILCPQCIYVSKLTWLEDIT